MKYVLAASAVSLAVAFLPAGASADGDVISLPETGRFTVSPHAGTAVHLEGRFMQSATEGRC